MTVPANLVAQQGQGSVGADVLNTYIQAVASVTALRGFAGVGQMTCYLQGFAAPNDGGQGTFVWSSTATGPDDGVNVIVPIGYTVGAWVRQTGVVTRTALLSGVYINPNVGGTPNASQLLDMWVLDQPTTFPASFAGSVFHVESGGLPATPRNCLINLNDSTVGGLLVNTNGTYSYSTVSASGFTAAAGQWITLVAPVAPDTAWNLFGFTLVGTRLS